MRYRNPPPNELGFRVVMEGERDIMDPRQPVCDLCGAVGYGALSCPACVAHWQDTADVLTLRLRQGRQN